MLNTPVHELLREFTSIVWKCGPDSAEARAYLLRCQHIEEFPSLARQACLMKRALDAQQADARQSAAPQPLAHPLDVQQLDSRREVADSFPLPRAA